MRNLKSDEIKCVSGGEGVPVLPPIIVTPPPQGPSATVTLRDPTQIELFLNQLAAGLASGACTIKYIPTSGSFFAKILVTTSCDQVGETVKDVLYNIEQHGGPDLGLTPCVDSVAGWKDPNICVR